MSQVILNFAIILALILAAGNFFRESHDKRIAYLFAGVMLSNVLSLGFVVANNYGITIVNPVLRSLMASFPFCIGPFYYFCFSAVFGYHDEWTWRRCLHFVPALAAFVFLIFMNLHFGPPGGEKLAVFRRYVFLTQSLHILMYYLITARMLNRFRQESREATVAMALTGAYALTFAIAAPAAFMTGGRDFFNLLTAAYAYNSLVFTVHYLLAQKYPLLFAMYVPAVKMKGQAAARDSLLTGEETGRIMRDLNRILEEEKIFLVEDLTLNALAHELGLTPHRLSYFLNNHAGMNFYTLVNSYRVKEAQAMLSGDPEKSIIRIAFDSGFSSKSSFNRAFQKITGMTPTDYRDRALGASGAHGTGQE